MKSSSNRDGVPQPLAIPELSPRALHKLSQREQMRITLRAILRDTWQPLWRLTRRFDKAWYALLISGILAVGHANSAPAHAMGISSSVSGGTLTVTGTPGDDTIALTVSAGNIKINGADPDSGLATGASVTSIQIDAGDGNDTVDLAALRRADLGANPSATVNPGNGDDTYRLSPDIGGTATDTAGNDTLQISADGEITFSSTSITINSSYITNISNSSNGLFERAVLLGGTGDDTFNAANAPMPVTFNGGAGDDTLTGSTFADRFVLSPGNDQINNGTNDTAELEFDGDITADATTVSWSAGTSTFNGMLESLLLRGGAGDNTIDASAYPAAVQIEGGDGDDTLRGGVATTFTGGAGADSFYPAAGTSTISDASAADGDRLFAPESSAASLTDTALTWTPSSSVSFTGTFAEVQLLGTAQDDLLDASAYSGRVVIEGRDGNDTLVGSQGGGVLEGGAGDDMITGGAGNDTFMPGAGTNGVTDTTAGDDDLLAYTGSGDMTLGATSLTTADGSTTFSSLVENALLTGDDGANVIDASGFGGSVTLRGLGGNDTLTDSANDDVIEGGDGNDTIFVGMGNDVVDAGSGDDRVEQPAPTAPNGMLHTNGMLQATSDDDILDGGAGIDTLVQRADGTQILSDTQLTGQGTDTISNFEQAELTGGAGDDSIDASGFSGNVVLRGLGGNDTLTGSQGDSVIEGGDGDDVITSGAGQNSIDGGPGTDMIDGVVEGTTLPPTDPTPPPTDSTVALYIPLLSKDR